MKHIFLLLLFASLGLNAQSVSPAPVSKPKDGLSKSELEYAKQLYISMMQTETYISGKKNSRKISKKLNGLKIPDYKEVNLCKMIDVRKWLTINIGKTNFKSPEEGVAMYEKGCELLEKLLNDNAELYELLRKANSQQFREIREPENRALLDGTFDE